MSTVRRLAKGGDVFRAGGTLAVDDGGNTQMVPMTQQGANNTINNNTMNRQLATRTKVHIPEAVMEDAVLMASEGKVSTKNAWDVKVIEGMEDTVANSLTDAGVDEYLTFTRMANVVESGAKVWTHRVDNTYQLSLQMVRRVLRTEVKADGDDKDGGDGADGADGTAASNKAKRRRAERTIADSVDEINLEGGPKTDNDKISDTVSPLFRAITKRYEQGHSKGLLMNNAPVGLCGNMILDVDYSKAGRSRQQVAAESETADTRAEMVRIEPVEDKAASPRGRKSAALQQEQALMSSLIQSVVPKEEQHVTPSRAQSQQRGASQLNASGADGSSAGGGSGFRAGSLANRNDDDYDNDNGDWGAVDDYGDDSMAVGDDMGGAGADGNGGDGSGVGGDDMARRIANGSFELARMERALATAVMGAVGGNGGGEDSWVDFSQDVADQLAKQRNFLFSKSLGSIRKQSIAVDKSQQPDAEQRELTQQAKRKARADKKIVTFITEEDMVDEASIREAMKLNATNATALTPLGKELLGYTSSNISLEQYGRDYQFCQERCKSHHFTLPSLKRDDLPWWLPVESGNVRSFYQPFCTESAQWGSLRKTRATLNAVGASRDVLQYDEEGRVVDEYTTDMPADVFDAGGDDYDDGGIDNDDYGGDDNLDTTGGYGSADMRNSGLFTVPIPYGLHDEDDDEVDAANDAFLNGEDGDEATAALRGTIENAIQLMDAPQMVEVLKVKTATLPTTVDVVRLREIMWRRVQELANFDPATGKACASASARNAFLGAGRKRPRDEGLGSEDEEDGFEGQLLAHLDDAKFSDVITSMLPDIRSITRDGVLSPAFFFFAILFLANEHRIILQNDPNDVADLFITRRMASMMPPQVPINQQSLDDE